MKDPAAPPGVLAEVNEQLLIHMIEAQAEMEAQAKALQEVRRHAESDALTQLPNRVLLLDRCARAIESARRHRGRLAILFLDIDEFKEINDRCGHRAGDQALKAVARRLLSAVRAVDTVSRFGGDEFVILISEIAAVSNAALIAAKVIAAMAIPDAEAPGLRVSLGISIYPDDGLDPESLISLADHAMYAVKQAGGGTWGRSGASPTESAQHDRTVGASGVNGASRTSSDPTVPASGLRIRDGSYRFDLRAYGYAGSGTATKQGCHIAGGDGCYQFWGAISESGGHASASVTVSLDAPGAVNPLIDPAFTMQMAGVIEDTGLLLLGIGPRGIIIEIKCSGRASDDIDQSAPPGVADASHTA